MTGALIILAVTLLTGLVLYLTHKPDKPGEAATSESRELPVNPENVTGSENATGSETTADSGECCGLHAVCEKVMTGTEKPVYFDDEELDRFARREPSTYSPEEVEEFREVLYTLLPEDVYQWGASLTLREIALPHQLRDEWIMLSQEGASAVANDTAS